jgi:hypothetical protein
MRVWLGQMDRTSRYTHDLYHLRNERRCSEPPNSEHSLGKIAEWMVGNKSVVDGRIFDLNVEESVPPPPREGDYARLQANGCSGAGT